MPESTGLNPPVCPPPLNWHILVERTMDETTRMTPAARAALVAYSQGSCDFPGCRTPVMVFLGYGPEVNSAVARELADDRGHVARAG